ncbi:MAG: hypothetical protein JNK54_07480 [Elusimicrobia bacterium]|nr:hypothetical protein [Elusimicrobiota bacterium]
MKTARALWLAVGWLGLLGVQAFHHHSAHDAGIYHPHEDCSFCARASGPAGADNVPETSFTQPTLSVRQVFFYSSPSLLSRPYLFPFGRAPPNPSV